MEVFGQAGKLTKPHPVHAMDSVTKGKLAYPWDPLHTRVVVDNKLDSLHVFTNLAEEPGLGNCVAELAFA